MTTSIPIACQSNPLRIARLLLTILFALAFVLGCDSSPIAQDESESPIVEVPGDDTDEPAPVGIGIAQTESTTSPIVFIHSEGTSLVPVLDPATQLLKSATFTDAQGNQIGILFGENEKPSLVSIDDILMLFRNYRETIVDIAVLDGDGNVEIMRDVDFSERLSEFSPASSPNAGALRLAKELHPKDTDWLALTNAIVQPLGIAGAIISAGIGITALSTAAVTMPVWATAAVGVGIAFPAIWSMASIAIENTDWIDFGVGRFSAVADAIGCAGGNGVSCATALVGGANSILSLINAVQQDRAEDLAALESALETASGDIQVTLTWTTEGDVDLHVFEPSGFEIFYGDPVSPSGGVLSDDNTEAHGPENISWPDTTPPEGRYRVAVHYYYGEVPTSYTVVLQAGGESRTYRGTLQPDEWQDVVQFEVGSPPPENGQVQSEPRVRPKSALLKKQ